jgi:hypothetical protein
MRATGYILQYSSTEKRGMVHLGGGEHASLLPFAFSDCDKKVQAELTSGQLPGGSAVNTQFEIALRDGGLVATQVSLARQKSSSARRNTKASRKRPKKPTSKRKR